MNFEQQDFLITQVKGNPIVQVPVTGFIAQETGLGYYYDGMYYVPTHLASGFALGPYLFFEEDAQAWIEAIVSLCDWTQPVLYFFTPEYHEHIVPELHIRLKAITLAYTQAPNYRELLARARAYVQNGQ